MADELDPDDVDAGAAAVRKYADDSGYGFYISDQKCREIAEAVLRAVKSQ